MGADAIAKAIEAALNLAGDVIKSQAAKLASIISVDQQATEYHSNVDISILQLSTAAEKQQTVIIAVLVIAVVIFLMMIMFIR